MEFDVTTNTPFVPEYLLYCDGSKIIINGTENLYALNFYNNLVANPNLGSTFAVNIAEMSFILPDLRNRVLRSSGSLLEPYKTQEDAIQNITGSLGKSSQSGCISDAGFENSGVGAFKGYEGGPTSFAGTATSQQYSSFDFDASRVVRTATETRVKSYGVFTCIDLRG